MNEIKIAIEEQIVDFKQRHDALMTKVDSMDNSYDKRVSNLEVVIAPFMA